MSKNIIIKGGAITKLEEISKTRESVNRLISISEDVYSLSSSNIDSIAGALTAIANSLSTVDTNNSNINVSHCTFTGLSTGLNISNAEQEYDIEPITEEEIEEDLSCEDDECVDTTIDTEDSEQYEEEYSELDINE